MAKFHGVPSSVCVAADKWKSHPEVKEMIELQQQGLAQSRGSGGSVGVPGNDPSDPEEGEEREEEGWESGDECQWTSEEGEKETS